MKILPTKVYIFQTILVVRRNNFEVFRYPTNMVPQRQEAPNSYILKPSFYRTEKHITFIKIKIIAFAK